MDKRKRRTVEGARCEFVCIHAVAQEHILSMSVFMAAKRKKENTHAHISQNGWEKKHCHWWWWHYIVMYSQCCRYYSVLIRMRVQNESIAYVICIRCAGGAGAAAEIVCRSNVRLLVFFFFPFCCRSLFFNKHKYICKGICVYVRRNTLSTQSLFVSSEWVVLSNTLFCRATFVRSFVLYDEWPLWFRT